MGATELLFLCACAILAGWVDAIAGGGGLIQIPALLAALPSAPVALVLGTNKLSSFCGTTTAVLRYHSLRFVNPGDWVVAVIAALCGSGIGAFCATAVPGAVMKPAVMVLLLLVLVATMVRGKPNVGVPSVARVPGAGGQAALGGGAGVYDGLFGPGTGSFLIFGLVRWCHLDYVRASAAAKVVNLATNFGALGMFVGLGFVDYRAGLPMAACNVLGAWLGATMAGRIGPLLVRRVFLVTVAGLFVKLAADYFRGL
ncbi:MAG: TSUP family transporter [Burkholderiales bacterium]|nr:TSUP family transporter [Burkholderiales bacterium]